MSNTEPNIYHNNIFVDGTTDNDVYIECFDTENQYDYEEVSAIAKTKQPDVKIPDNIPKIQSIKEDNSRSKKKHAHLRFMFLISGFVIILVASNGVTFIITKDILSEDKSNMTPCTGLKCLNGGSCEVLNGTFQCLCESGFSGSLCEVTPCFERNCLNGGSCEVLNGMFHCSCKSGFSGHLCEVTPCTGRNCLNGGSCEVLKGVFQCLCKPGFSGDLCEDILHQIITSPGYPSSYKHNTHEQWNIDVGLSNTVRITFTQIELESNYDFVKVYNGQSTTCCSLANYTGTIYSKELTSTGRYMTILFTTDGSGTKSGFRAVIYKITN
ncbi:Hypothetical predicted protein [Mytilus galloprovincialis]|uniref:Uncharacterized protein n=1 Tax=Mytilus galloprovincialis TaxID=29158 RepID=A0A8B6F057_MYTGA|nr:Hypothetical predicted protein [Mytilus galloprovincialis]